MYNLTSISQNATSFVDIMVNTNNVLMSGMLGLLLLIALTAISFISFYYYTREPGKSAGGAMILCLGFSVLLRAMGMVNDITIVVVLILTAVTVIMSKGR